MRKSLTTHFSIFIILICFVFPALSWQSESKNSSQRRDEVPREITDTEAFNIFQRAFPNFKTPQFTQSEIKGLYEIEADGNIIIFDPRGKYLVFGDVIDSSGKNITAEKRKRLTAKKLSGTELDKAVKIGNGPQKVVVFTDPDCPYCKKVSEYLNRVSSEVTQYVFFVPLTQLHPRAEAKSKFILSAADPAKAYREVANGSLDETDPGTIKFDEKAAVLLQEHISIARSVGVKGTPTLWIRDHFVAGANLPLIEQLIKSKDPDIPTRAAKTVTGTLKNESSR